MNGRRDTPPVDPATVKITERATWASGVPGVAHGLAPVLAQVGPRRGVRTLLRLNQPDGFDCPGCAWPDPADTSHFEFCVILLLRRTFCKKCFYTSGAGRIPTASLDPIFRDGSR